MQEICYIFKSPMKSALKPEDNKIVYKESQNIVLSIGNSPFS